MQDKCDRTRIETGVVSSILVIDDQTSREKRQLLRDVRLDAAQSSPVETKRWLKLKHEPYHKLVTGAAALAAAPGALSENLSSPPAIIAQCFIQ